MDAVIQKTSLGRTTIYAYMKEGRFPAAVHTGRRRVGWLESEIDAWLKDRADERPGTAHSESGMDAYFPVVWTFAGNDGVGGPPVRDAGTIYFTNGVEQSNPEVLLKTTLNDVVLDAIEGAIGGDGFICAEQAADVARLRDALLAAALKINEALPLSKRYP